ncbi:MAG: flagellar type III secretion system pore protein FliP [Ruminococcaceae bacterium]|nr:flagellar type III secretion system pore protein FliP [Oscillospiraceae bacterium]
MRKLIFTISALLTVILLIAAFALKTDAASINIDVSGDEEGGLGTLELLFVFVLIALAPTLLIMMTSFTRIVIVLSLTRNALGLQSTPPNQVIIGLALFLSLFIMAPVGSEIKEKAIDPYRNGEITQEVALEEMQNPIKEFMLKQTKSADLNLFLSLSGNEANVNIETGDTDELMGIGIEILIPAFLTSEIARAFMIGFFLFLPFLVIDMIVASTLMSVGMVMLPPSTIALPFKIMLFVVVDGWRLIIEMLITSFY